MKRLDALASRPVEWQKAAVMFIAAANELVALEDDSLAEGAMPEFSWSSHGTTWPVLLLYAVAVENLLKAIRISQGEPVVAEGRLARYFGSHRLSKFAEDAGLGVGDTERDLLARLQDVLEAGKYPVAKTSDGNPGAWTFEYPADVETVWTLLERLDALLRSTGTECVPPFEARKLRYARG